MFRLGDILGEGYQAHVLTYRSMNQTGEALKALTVSDHKEDNGVAAIVQDLVGGDISAQSRAIYNSNLAISILQTLDYSALMIRDNLSFISEKISQTDLGVYSEFDVAQFQIQVDDSVRSINNVACKTGYNGQKFLCNDEGQISVYLDNAHSVDIVMTDLRVEEGSIALATDLVAAGQTVTAAMGKVFEYRETLNDQIEHLNNQIALADTDVAKTMGYGMNELNDDVARAIAQDVVGDILGQSVVALQSQANVDKTRAVWLFNGALRKPNIND